MTKTRKMIGFRPTEKIQEYVDSELAKDLDKKISQIIIELLEKALSYSGVEEPSSQHVTRGADLETHQQVRRGDKILVPCPRLNKWVDRKLDCEGCHLKCNIRDNEHIFLQGLALYTKR